MGRYMKALQNPTIIGVLLGLLLLYHGCVVLATSGGRMGGSFFSDDDDMSGSSESTTIFYHSPTGYRGGGVAKKQSISEMICEILFLLAFLFVLMGLIEWLEAKETSVLKLQVGLLGKARSLQRDLNQIAEVADTSSPKGLSFVLQETTLALLRHPDYCISGYSSVVVKRSNVEVEKLFNQLSIEERGKFNATVVNVNNIRMQRATNHRSNDFRNKYIVITIIVAAGGVHKLPLIDSRAKLKKALEKLATIPSSRVKAMEVLWTPENENDTLKKRKYYEDYSLLHPL